MKTEDIIHVIAYMALIVCITFQALRIDTLKERTEVLTETVEVADKALTNAIKIQESRDERLLLLIKKLDSWTLPAIRDSIKITN